jgi:hypothetical protein
LRLEAAGKPDLGCFVVAPHGKKAAKFVSDMTLDHALGALGTQNFFTTLHYPPKLVLEFTRRCQFPQPFPY